MSIQYNVFGMILLPEGLGSVFGMFLLPDGLGFVLIFQAHIWINLVIVFITVVVL